MTTRCARAGALAWMGSVLIGIGILLSILQWALTAYLVLHGRGGEIESGVLPRTLDVNAPIGGGKCITISYPGLVLAALGTIHHVAAECLWTRWGSRVVRRVSKARRCS
ncbi:hypothetical protein [Polyangium fumosum]|uniref:Uncharacterized protein n=1 Tax=Polyangium fumosum TaxID=889272 RepID=A0A4V5PN40_9BACT|nr:hypothetical protein [Polyangium fumosum]TKC98743.1 hypothetical protein E8A74_40280 [Polyangium fumosum]